MVASIVRAVIEKGDPQSTLGISIAGKTLPCGRLVPVITKVDPDGPSSQLSRAIGLRILTINGVACQGRDGTLAMLRLAQGQITVEAGPISMVAATVTKTSPDQKLGINLAEMESPNDGLLVVTKVTEGGLFSKTQLKVGMKIHSINGNVVRKAKLQDAASLVQDLPGGNVTILALDMTARRRHSTPTSSTTTKTKQLDAFKKNNLDSSLRSLGGSVRNLGAEKRATKRRNSLKIMDVPLNRDL